MQTFEVVSIAGDSLWAVRQGRGPALVCCHGGPGLWDYLEPVAAMLDDQWTVYRYDQRSYGRSAGEPPYDVATAVADLDALREHWGLSWWVVLGHSWGATLALAYGLTHPTRTRALIYLSGTGIDASWHVEYRANRAALLSSEDQRQLANLRVRLSTAQGPNMTRSSGPTVSSPGLRVLLLVGMHESWPGSCLSPTCTSISRSTGLAKAHLPRA